MKRSYWIAAGLAAAVGLWLGTGLLDGESAPAAGPAAKAADQQPVSVRVRTSIARPHVRQLVLFGRTEAARTVKVRAETDGRVVAKLVEKGQRVAAGTPLARLSMDDRQARLKEAEALVEQREVAYKAARALSKSGFRSQVKMAEERALLEQARAHLAAARLDIERTTIRAPFAGVVEEFPVEVGDYVYATPMGGGGVVATIVDLDPIKLVVEVAEKEANLLTVGEPAEVRLVTGDRRRGIVRYRGRSAKETTRTFRAEIEVPNPEGAIAEGITAEVKLRLGTVAAHRVSPAVLTLNDAGEIGVKVVEGDVAKFRRVRLVDDTPQGLWLAGLPEEVRVITVGQEFVLAGQRVRPVADLSPSAGSGTPQ